MRNLLNLKQALTLLGLLFIATVSFAQAEPVTWTFSVEKVSADEYDIIFTAKMERGWSLYSQFMDPSKGPIPTQFNFKQSKAIKLVGKAKEAGNKKEIFDELFGMTLIKFSGRARFTQRIKVDAATKAIKGQLTYMTCDEKSCLPPMEVDFDIVLN